MQSKRQTLRDELYLLAHKENGEPRIHVPSLSLGLAAATVIDLILAERVTATEELLSFRDLTPTGDPIADSLLSTMLANPGRRDLKTWISNLGNEIHERTGSWLHMSGTASQQKKRRLLAEDRIRYRPLDPKYVLWLHSLLHQVTRINPRVDDQSAALCGLAAVLRLEQLSGTKLPTSQLLWRLNQAVEVLTGDNAAPIRSTIAAAEELISALAVAVHR